jgi:hypothetical protein
MDKGVLYVVDLVTVKLDETTTDGQTSDTSWVHALPLGEYQHPVFGKMKYTADKIRAFADSVNVRVRGIDPSINIMHGVNGGDGEAAGWVKKAEARPDGLWVFVEWTKSAASKIKEKAWRYFSAEYQDKWTDAGGREHRDVFFGGALTNRPYMKNLLPINLSEGSVDAMVGLAELVVSQRQELAADNATNTPAPITLSANIDGPTPGSTGTPLSNTGASGTNDPSKEVDVDLKTLTELLGLPEGTTEADVLAKLAELKPTTPVVVPPVTPPTVPKVQLSEELRKLSEDNPMVKALLDTVDAQNKALAEHNIALREADVSRRLSEFDRSKIVLTPTAKDMVHDFAMDLPIAMSDRFWEILEKMRASSAMMVELGERAGTSVRYGRAKDPVSMFMDEANKIAKEKEITLSEAMEQVATGDPKLYNEYRANSYSYRD